MDVKKLIDGKYEYFAFISYKREDEEWAKWLAHELEHYHLPLTLDGREDLPKELRPIFRDTDELSAGNLPQQIHNALECSKHLIVICSPRSAKSPWVNKEIEEFISMGKTDHIFPFIIDGIAMCKNPDDPEECFPSALRNLPKDDERLGANVNEYGHGNKLRTCDDCPIREKRNRGNKRGDINDKGRDAAVVKIIAGMLGLSFDTLWQRYEREKAVEERKIREQRDKLLIMQSRFLAEKANTLVDEGDSYTARLLALEALPKDMKNPNRPLVHEAEMALRQATHEKTGIFKGHENFINSISLSPKGKYLASASQDDTIRIWDTDTGYCLNILEKPSSMYISNFKYEALDSMVACTQGFNNITYSPDGKMIVATGCGNQINVWETKSYRHIITLYGKDYVSTKIMALFIDGSNKLIVAGTKGEEDEDTYLFPEDHGLVLWNCKTWEVERVISEKEEDVNIITVNCVNKYVACAGIYGPSIRVYNFETGMLINEMIHKSSFHISINCISFSPNGDFLLSGGDDGRLHVWNVKTGAAVWISENFSTALHCVVYSPSGRYIACSDSIGTIHILEGYNFNIIQDVNCHYDVHSIVFTPDEKGIFSAGRDNEIHLWELNSCITNNSFIPLHSLQDDALHKNAVRMKDLLVDHISKHKLFAHVSTYENADNSSNSIAVNKEGSSVSLVELEVPSKINSIAFSLDGEKITAATEDKKVRVWNIKSIFDVQSSIDLECSNIFDDHSDEVVMAFFCPKGNHIVSIDKSNEIRIWNLQYNGCVFKYACLYKIEFAIFSSDGTQLYIVDSNKRVEVIQFPQLEDLIKQQRLTFQNRKFTLEECKKYYLD